MLCIFAQTGPKDFWRWRYLELSEKVTDGSHEPPPGMQWEWGGARNDTDWCLGKWKTTCEIWTCPTFERDFVREDMFLAKAIWRFVGTRNTFRIFDFSTLGWGSEIGEGTDEFGNLWSCSKKSMELLGSCHSEIFGHNMTHNNLMLPPRKLTWQWTIHHLKMYFRFRIWIFQCHVSFQGCTYSYSSYYIEFFFDGLDPRQPGRTSTRPFSQYRGK